MKKIQQQLRMNNIMTPISPDVLDSIKEELDTIAIYLSSDNVSMLDERFKEVEETLLFNKVFLSAINT